MKTKRPDKNDAMVNVRLPSEMLNAFSKMAEGTNDTASGLIRLLMERWIESYVDHGKYLIYPPEFNYFPHVKSHQEEQLLAAEDSVEYKLHKGKK